MTKKYWLQLLVTVSILCLVQSGQIWSWADPQILNPNVDFLKKMYLYFKLDSGLKQGGYLQVTFPNSWVPSVLKAEQSFWTTSNDRCKQLSAATVTINNIKSIIQSLKPGEPNTFYFLFDKDIKSNETNILWFNILFPEGSPPKGLSTPMTLKTVTLPDSSNYMIFDENPTFAQFDIAETPNLGMSVTVDDYQQNSPNQNLSTEYYMNFSFQPTIQILNEAKILIELTGGFSYKETQCKNTAYGDFSLGTVLPEFTYSCLRASKTVMELIMFRTLIENERLRFRVKVGNPFNITSGNIKIYTYERFNNRLVEYGEMLNALISQKEDMDQHYLTAQIGWGIDIMTAPKHPFKLYRDFNPPKYYYQSLKLNFKVRKSLPTNEPIRVVLNVGPLSTTTKYDIIISSLNNNFQPYNNGQIKCYTKIINADTYFFCDNIAALWDTNSYFLAFRIWLAYDLTLGDLGSDFGTFHIMIAVDGIYADDLSTVIITAKSETPLNIIDNTDILGANRIRSKYTTTDNTNNVKFIIGSIPQDFVFNFKLSQIDFGSFNNTQPRAGIDIYTFTFLTISDYTFDQSSTFGAQNKNISRDGLLIQTTTVEPYYTNIRCNLPFGPSDWAGSWDLTIKYLNLFSSSSWKADEAVFDVYMANMNDYIPGEDQPGINLILSYIPVTTVIDPSLTNIFSNVYVSVTAGWTDSSGNDGSNFPTLVRIYGKMTSSESAGVKKLALFYNNLIPFELSDKKVQCSGLATSTSNIPVCYSFEGKDPTAAPTTILDYSKQRRIEIVWTAFSIVSAEYQMLIPFQTIANKPNIYLGVATFGGSTQGPLLYNIYGLNTLRTLAAIPQPKTDKGETFGLPETATFRVGELRTSVSLNVKVNVGGAAADKTIVAKNTAALKGASFLYCVDWEFSAHPNFQVINNMSPKQNLGDACQKLTYTDTQPVQHFCIYCPVNSDLSLSTVLPMNNFYIWPTSVTYSGQQACLSTNTGQLASCQNPITTILPASISNFTQDPLYFAVDQKLVKLQISFTTVNTIPAGGVIIVKFNSDLQITQETGGACILNITQTSYVECTLKFDTNFDTFAFLVKFNEPTQLDPGIYILNFYNIIFTSNTPENQTFTLHTRTDDTLNSFKIDELPTGSTSGILEFGPSNQFPVDFTLKNGRYMIGYLGAMSYMELDFYIVGRLFYYKEEIIFNLSELLVSPNNQNSIYCFVLKNNLVIQDFSQCTVDITNKKISLIVKYDISEGEVYTLRINRIQSVQFTTEITAELKGPAGTLISNSIILQSESTIPLYNLTNIALPNNQITLSKKYNTVYSLGELNFSIQSSPCEIDQNGRIVVIFPSYYMPHITIDQNPFCQANQQKILCLIEDRQIVFTGFAKILLKNSQVQISIQGVQVPPYVTPQNFQLAFDDDMDNKYWMGFAFVSDISAPYSGVNSLRIQNFKTSQRFIRVQTTYQWTLQLLQNVDANYYIVLDFPDIWDDLILNQFGTIVFTEFGEETNLLQTQFQRGKRIKAKISTSLKAQKYYLLTLTGLETFEYVTQCRKELVTLSIVDQSEQSVIARTSPSLLNINREISIKYNSKKVYLMWDNREILVPQGLYCKTPIKLGQYQVNLFNKTLLLEYNNDLIKSSPNLLTTFSSQPRLTFLLAAESFTPYGTYYIKFTPTEYGEKQYFSKVPYLKLKINSDKAFVKYLSILQRIPINGTSLPVRFSIDQYPYFQIQIDCNIIEGADLVQIDQTTNKILTISRTNAIYIFKVLETAQLNSIVKINYTISGVNAKSYQFENISSAQSEFEIIDILDDPPKFEMIINPTDVDTNSLQVYLRAGFQETDNQKIIESQTQIGIVWHILYHNTLNRTFEEVNSLLVQNVHSYKSQDIYQEQVGYYSIPSVQRGGIYSFKVSNLRAAKEYKFSMWIFNQANQNLTMPPAKIGTKTNGGQIFKAIMILEVEKDGITNFLLNKILCYINEYFQIDSESVRTTQNEYCNNLTTIVKYKNIWNITDKREVNTQNGQKFNLTFWRYYQQIVLYIYPDDTTQSDRVFTQVSTLMYSNLDIWIQNTRGVLGEELQSLLQVAPVNQPFTNRPYFVYNLEIEIGKDFVKVHKLKLNTVGFIYGVIVNNNSNITNTTPTPQDIRWGKGIAGNESVDTCGKYQESLNSNFTCTFERNLVPGNFYEIYITASNDDPAEFSNFTKPIKFFVQVPPLPPAQNSNLLCLNIIFILIIIIFIFI